MGPGDTILVWGGEKDEEEEKLEDGREEAGT
jgi:hypothetical protein